MKVSEWLREYQVTGLVPDHGEPPMLAFVAGWMLGRNRVIYQEAPMSGLEMAIKVAEFIEENAKG